ncbi:MAG: 30S ribosome-binding factor RbfA [Candidatus Fermentibacteraceae bacterium]|nr:30S ribosome-binding factor RbfA [Candidatus Fermentibacteraceae bacterium]MBN2608685.1 30S ribosome-binding factor RbfA [Candidatus Fermentibacteraceae bacterium]
MNDRRRQRLAGDMLQSLEDILSREVSDERLQRVHVTRVKLSRDGSHATLFYEATGTEEQQLETVEAMESARGFLRSQLALRVRMKGTPALSLVFDSSGEQGDRTLGIIRELNSD